MQRKGDVFLLDHGILAGMTWHSFDLEIKRQRKTFKENEKYD